MFVGRITGQTGGSANTWRGYSKFGNKRSNWHETWNYEVGNDSIEDNLLSLARTRLLCYTSFSFEAILPRDTPRLKTISSAITYLQASQVSQATKESSTVNPSTRSDLELVFVWLLCVQMRSSLSLFRKYILQSLDKSFSLIQKKQELIKSN